LGNILRKSDNAEIAQSAADIIRFFSERGLDAGISLKDVWHRSIPRTVALFAVAFAAPIILLAAICVPSFNGPRPSGPTSAWTLDETSDAFSNTFGPSAESDPQVVPAAASRPSSMPSELTCDAVPANGEILVDHRGDRRDGHHLKIENGSAGDAIVKMRELDGRTLASFFVVKGETATLNRIPDGSYTVQFASGDKLAKDCRTFVADNSLSASEFPGPESLQTRYEDGLDGTTVVHSVLTYTLYPVPGGTVRPTQIELGDFNKP
jgi:hypothetical protein